MRSCPSILSLILLLTCTNGEDEDFSKSFSECSDSTVFVEEIVMTCDSPGAYYYGGSNYRNSATCVGGDKGRLQLAIQIAEDLEADPFIDITAKGYGSVADASILSGASFCDSVSSVNGVTCPGAGYYQFQDVFYWEEQNDELEYSFSPKISVGIRSTEGSEVYDLGGANTNWCSGNAISNWSAGFRKSAASALKTFFVTFGILFGAVILVAAAGFFIMRQSRGHQQEVAEEEDKQNEYQKMAMVGNNATLVDA